MFNVEIGMSILHCTRYSNVLSNEKYKFVELESRVLTLGGFTCGMTNCPF